MAGFQEIEVNGEILEFPVDMSDEQIAAVLSGNVQPSIPAPQDAYNPTEGMSNVDRLLAGVGKAFSDIGLGAQQRASDIANFFPPSPMTLGSRFSQESLQKEAQSRRERDAPLLATGAGLTGNIAGHMAAGLPLGGLVTSIPRAIGLGVAESTLMPTAEEGELGTNALIGGAAGAGGQLLARGAQRLFQPVQQSLSGRGADAVDLLRREGINLDVAQRTGSPAAQRVRSALGDNPLTVTGQNRFLDSQKRQFTRAALRRIGADADEATPDVLQSATRRIGREIENAVDSTPPMFDTGFAADVRRIQQSIAGQLTEADARPILNNINDIFRGTDPQTNVISPAVFRRVRSNLSALRSNPGTGSVASELEDALLDSLQRAGGDREGLGRAIAHWRNWKIIENSIDKGTDKTISPARLATTFGQKRNRAVSLRHVGHPETVELSRLADAGRSVLPETLGNSGTFGRALVGEGLLAAGGFGGALATGQDVSSAAAIGLGAGALPLLLQRGMLSQGGLGNFLSEGGPQALQGLTQSPLTQALLRQGAISSGLLGSQ